MKRNEETVLYALKAKCGNGVSAITSINEILSIALKRSLDSAAVERSLKALESGGFIEKTDCLKNGENHILITLTKRALNYETEKKNGKKRAVFRLLWAVGSALLTFVLGRLLVILFT